MKKKVMEKYAQYESYLYSVQKEANYTVSMGNIQMHLSYQNKQENDECLNQTGWFPLRGWEG